MKKYIIEGNINFYDELYKSLDDSDKEDEPELCQISGTKLTDRFVTLECGHKFNYQPLCKEIYNQKYVYRTYTFEQLDNKNKQKFINSGKNYYIRCPYCREIQFTILPYYADTTFQYREVYGVNSLNDKLCDALFIQNYYSIHNTQTQMYYMYGETFKFMGKPCSGPQCYAVQVAKIEGTDLHYCGDHWRTGLSQYKKNLKIKEKQEKMLVKQQLAEQKA